MRIAVRAAIVAAIGGGIALWVRYLSRRRSLWAPRLASAIPLYSQYWRERMAEDGELLYVAIGDSAAQGIGASRPAHGYAGFLADHIRQRSARTVRVANLSISGATVRIAIDSELPALAALHREPDVLTVCIGANDIAGFEAQRFERDIRELFAALPSHAIVADLPSFYFLPGERKVRVANRILRAAANDHGLTVVPLHANTDRQGLWGVSTQFSGDLFHPNDRGYRIWAATFTSAVDARLDALAR